LGHALASSAFIDLAVKRWLIRTHSMPFEMRSVVFVYTDRSDNAVDLVRVVRGNKRRRRRVYA
jgi:hypothetical protein